MKLGMASAVERKEFKCGRILDLWELLHGVRPVLQRKTVLQRHRPNSVELSSAAERPLKDVPACKVTG